MAGARVSRLGPRLTISFAAADYEALHSLAQASDVSVSWVVRQAVAEYLERQSLRRPRSRPRVIPKLTAR